MHSHGDAENGKKCGDPQLLRCDPSLIAATEQPDVRAQLSSTRLWGFAIHAGLSRRAGGCRVRRGPDSRQPLPHIGPLLQLGPVAEAGVQLRRDAGEAGGPQVGFGAEGAALGLHEAVRRAVAEEDRQRRVAQRRGVGRGQVPAEGEDPAWGTEQRGSFGQPGSPRDAPPPPRHTGGQSQKHISGQSPMIGYGQRTLARPSWVEVVKMNPPKNGAKQITFVARFLAAGQTWAWLLGL